MSDTGMHVEVFCVEAKPKSVLKGLESEARPKVYIREGPLHEDTATTAPPRPPIFVC